MYLPFLLKNYPRHGGGHHAAAITSRSKLMNANTSIMGYKLTRCIKSTKVVLDMVYSAFHMYFHTSLIRLLKYQSELTNRRTDKHSSSKQASRRQTDRQKEK